MSRSDIDDTVRDMWSTRPPRRRDDRKIAGVAAAIGRRYGIDPILLRVAFVVTTIFGGVGIMLYLLGWLLLREEGDEVSGAEALLGQGRSSMSKPLTIVLMLALIPASSGLFTAQLSALFSVAAVAAAVYLLHRHRAGTQAAMPAGGYGAPADLTAGSMTAPTMPGTAAGPQPGTAPGAPPGMQPGMASAADPTAPTYAAPTYAAPTTGTPGQGTAQDTVHGQPADGSGRQQPPAWDPLGVAPFAWDLPDPTPAPPPPAPPQKRRRSVVTPLTLALALMVAGAGAIVAMTSSTIGAAEVAAATLAVVGGGLVVGSFVRGGRGLIAVAIPLAIATYAMSVVPAEHFGPNGVGDRTWVVHGPGDLQPTYRHSVGDATLDLRQLTLTDTDVENVTVQLGLGDLDVLLPPNVDVEVHCEAGVGDIDCLDQSSDGRNPIADTTDGGEDGIGRGGKLVLNASVGTGDLEVTRG